MSAIRYLPTASILLALLAGCGEDDKPKPVSTTVTPKAAGQATNPQPAETTTAQPQPDAAKPKPESKILPMPVPGQSFRGTVHEAIDATGYTYLRLETDHGMVWGAAPKFAVSVGDTVEAVVAQHMNGFRSRSLDRTFDQLMFLASAKCTGDTAAPESSAPPQTVPAGHPSGPAAADTPKPQRPAAPAPAGVEALADGHTVEALFAKKNDLAGKPVRFRGRVVKANRGILGKNWLHIQDGTGGPGTNDITVTSVDGYADPGTVVVIEGTLALDKDFGAGYKYAVIVENAKVTAQPAKKPDAAEPDETEPKADQPPPSEDG